MTEDGRYLLFYLYQPGNTHNAIYYRDLLDPLHPKPDGPVVPLLGRFDADYIVLGNHGDTFYVSTNLNAVRGRIVAINLKAPALTSWTRSSCTSGKPGSSSSASGRSYQEKTAPEGERPVAC